MGTCGSGVESGGCWFNSPGACPWVRYCSWCAGRHLAWQPLPSVYELHLLWTKVLKKPPQKALNINVNISTPTNVPSWLNILSQSYRYKVLSTTYFTCILWSLRRPTVLWLLLIASRSVTIKFSTSKHSLPVLRISVHKPTKGAEVSHLGTLKDLLVSSFFFYLQYLPLNCHFIYLCRWYWFRFRFRLFFFCIF